jgi:hypothetical protein
MLLKTGATSYQNTDFSGISRWGDYSATTVDPVDSSRFWTIQEFPSTATRWSTQVTELRTGIPVLHSTVSGSNLMLSWFGTVLTLQTATDLGNPTWTAVTQNLSTNNGSVSAQLPMSAVNGFFRLKLL